MLFAALEAFLHQCLNIMQVNICLILVEVKDHLVSYNFMKLVKYRVNIFAVFPSDLHLAHTHILYNNL